MHDPGYAVRIEVAGGEAAPPLVFGQLDFVERVLGDTLPWLDATLPIAPLASPASALAPPVRVVPGPRPARPRIKCVVWDLDNTLWTGTLAEDGPEGVRPRRESVALLHTLDTRGILNSIASKNDAQPALAALQRYGLADYFIFPQIGWGPKSASIRAIANDIDIALDTFAFIDDQPFERGEVIELLADVEVFADTAIASLAEHPRFDVPVTPEASQRRRSYQTEQRRRQVRMESGLDYDAFLRSCELRLSIAPLTIASAPRAHELTERTNQLNTSGRRFTRAQIDALARGEHPRLRADVLSVSDRFGKYGLVGFLVLDRVDWTIQAFFMSCRVQRKRVEHALFASLLAEAAAAGSDAVDVIYRPSSRNGPVLAMLEELGFRRGEDADGAQRLRRSTTVPIEGADIVTVAIETPHRLPEAGE
jgi:FkbH-like protein